jgi:hypothetical protein
MIFSDVYIDEVSPSEDERVAEALLRDYRFRDLVRYFVHRQYS